MAKKRSEKSKYPSRYSPSGWVSFHQYITELVCEKKAQADNKDLPIKFWELKEWSAYYKYQATLAASLAKKYTEESIIKAIKECFKLTSLRSPVLISMIEKNEKTTPKTTDKPLEYEFKENVEFKEVKRKTKLSKLKDLDLDG